MADFNSSGAGGIVPRTGGMTVNDINSSLQQAYNAGVNSRSQSPDVSYLNSQLSDISNYIQSAQDIAEYNTMTSQALAREQMRFQEQANAKAMDFNATEAQKTRDWQTMMSNTAHQREVSDLIKAGLNPVLSANQGAAVGSASSAQGVTSSGAKGSVDTSLVNAMVSLYAKNADMIMQDKNLEMQQKQIDSQVLMNALTNDTNRLNGSRSAQATMYAADANSSAHRYAAELDYSTWSQGLHNQYAQLGEWIYKALSGLNFSDMFNFSISDLFGGSSNSNYDGTGYRTHSKTEEGNTPSKQYDDIHGRTYLNWKNQ